MMDYKWQGSIPGTLVYTGLSHKMLAFSDGRWRIDYWNDAVEQGDGRIAGQWLIFCSGKESTQVRGQVRAEAVYEALTQDIWSQSP